ncbi:16S rRNA (guanine(966)-N(2))-methyltransferase RsmD [Nocardia cyriacigeorgica]|uniref:16S rRNA (guanine(966)-N(2))-methyltransferase RsmD n=1 Tax=Nocardia cyriacigeorgica TaxID=135487 RepID=UPI0013D0BE9C|nr:16S rRNA (guanine(966)-N(2))-methyltransferase RsmD [Nocardia cyriacigeorgica]MBF6436190.1 16S rRNA (guanine(966)-N(2))-methyltransferase RsmD [Nocardia cyriacigeorgica]MBF6456822.1 16S rRNA (guanine(966)-N(2))-methyltransferase RsmD [Nocardia cyriacigeorgica]MBF6481944.1 16S rRNA (guanine(966)-N(2))-methyltransferase RsmD [Nocardia cyriacigeorgica]MBF6551627.1 16S rRNA (guanine(966)-N(2))-methyltransferase RsmD [Nocardia cyriacigeorgica]NEW26358.1 16S rRNA (guanine(966)-N(2))-methyltransfe
MTRIVAGTAGGRRLRVPPAGTRPTSDRVREALFSAIDARLDLEGARVLDLYAGSGALGLEALSRGAARAMLIESDRKAAAVVRGNIADLGLPGAELRVGSVASVLAQPAPVEFDLVFSDPPYDLDTATVVADLTALAGNGWLAPDALVVVERSSRSPEIDWPAGYSARKPRRYGETRIELAEFDGAPAEPGPRPASV